MSIKTVYKAFFIKNEGEKMELNSSGDTFFKTIENAVYDLLNKEICQIANTSNTDDQFANLDKFFKNVEVLEISIPENVDIIDDNDSLFIVLKDVDISMDIDTYRIESFDAKPNAKDGGTSLIFANLHLTKVE